MQNTQVFISIVSCIYILTYENNKVNVNCKIIYKII